MKTHILRILAVILVVATFTSCGPDYFLRRNKFYRYKTHWHKRWSRPSGHYGTGYF